MDQLVTKTIMKSDDMVIEFKYYKDMPIVSYYTIETEDLFYTQDGSYVDFKCRHSLNTDATLGDITELLVNNLDKSESKDVTEKDIIELLLKDHERYVEAYKKGLATDDPGKCVVYHNKRDLVRQSMKLVLSMKFSNMAIYKYLVDSYSYIEDGYEYMYIFLENMWSVIKDEVLEIVKKDLKEYQNIDYDKVLVYRGFNKYSREDGVSYTFNYKTAKFFADRWDSQGYVNMYEVDVKDILAYIHHEEEIITNNAKLLAENVKGSKVTYE